MKVNTKSYLQIYLKEYFETVNLLFIIQSL